MSARSQYRCAMITSFRFDYNNIDKWGHKNEIKYAIWQLEECPTTKKQHIQGYVEFEKRPSLKNIKELFLDGSMHIEHRMGKQSDAIKYCSKKETRIEGPWEYGNRKQQGERSDLKNIIELCKKKKTLAEIIEEVPTALRLTNHIEKYKKSLIEPRDRNKPIEVIVLIGKPGTGKTKYVYDNENDLFTLGSQHGGSLWFDGYTGQKAMLIDDYKGNIQYTTLLRLLDRYPFSGQTKGGYVNLNLDRIYITSNYEVNEWYNQEWDKSALHRRITKTIVLNDPEAKSIVPEVPGNTLPAPDIPIGRAREDNLNPVGRVPPRPFCLGEGARVHSPERKKINDYSQNYIPYLTTDINYQIT